MGFLGGLTPIQQLASARVSGNPNQQATAGYGYQGGQQQSPINPDDMVSQLANMRSQLQSQDPAQALAHLRGLAGSGIGPGTPSGGGPATPYTTASPASANVSGSLGQWLQQAEQLAGVSGPDWTKGLGIIAQHESSGNPNAVNNWDSNAKAGHPSEGLMQTIGPTFNEYALPGHTNIFNPVDNAIAAIRYIQSRYGGIDNVPGVRNVDSGLNYVGY